MRSLMRPAGYLYCMYWLTHLSPEPHAHSKIMKEDLILKCTAQEIKTKPLDSRKIWRTLCLITDYTLSSFQDHSWHIIKHIILHTHDWTGSNHRIRMSIKEQPYHFVINNSLCLIKINQISTKQKFRVGGAWTSGRCLWLDSTSSSSSTRVYWRLANNLLH